MRGGGLQRAWSWVKYREYVLQRACVCVCLLLRCAVGLEAHSSEYEHIAQVAECDRAYEGLTADTAESGRGLMHMRARAT